MAVHILSLTLYLSLLPLPPPSLPTHILVCCHISLLSHETWSEWKSKICKCVFTVFLFLSWYNLCKIWVFYYCFSWRNIKDKKSAIFVYTVSPVPRLCSCFWQFWNGVFFAWSAMFMHFSSCTREIVGVCNGQCFLSQPCQRPHHMAQLPCSPSDWHLSEFAWLLPIPGLPIHTSRPWADFKVIGIKAQTESCTCLFGVQTMHDCHCAKMLLVSLVWLWLVLGR